MRLDTEKNPNFPSSKLIVFSRATALITGSRTLKKALTASNCFHSDADWVWRGHGYSRTLKEALTASNCFHSDADWVSTSGLLWIERASERDEDDEGSC